MVFLEVTNSFSLCDLEARARVLEASRDAAPSPRAHACAHACVHACAHACAHISVFSRPPSRWYFVLDEVRVKVGRGKSWQV